MRFDDRLQTLLEAPIADHRDRTVRWRQLVDLLARIEPGTPSAAVSAGLDLVRREAGSIDEAVRAATVRAIAGRKLPIALLAILAAQPMRIAAPLFAGLALSEEDARFVLARADDDVRALVRIDTAAPDAGSSDVAGPASDPAASDNERLAELSISAMVERIERLAIDRSPRRMAMALLPPAPEDSPVDDSPVDDLPAEDLPVEDMPLAEPQLAEPQRAEPSLPVPPPFTPRRQPAPQPARRLSATGDIRRLFDWESDSSGHIAWVDGVPRGALVGRSLGGGGGGVGLLEPDASARIGQRHPFIDVALTPGETIPGTWSATGVPAFDPATGRFLGYRGLARRTDGAVPVSAARDAPDIDALRELVHEIKTPLNAIIGFAEIIDGQYLGPAHARYRERAASIVGQARHLLDAVEDLDFAARVRADRAGATLAAGEAGGARMGDLFAPIAAELHACLADHKATLELDLDDQRHRCALSPELAGRLLRRLLLSLCKIVGEGETFRVAVSRRGGMSLLTVARPRALDGMNEAQLVDPAFDPAHDMHAAADDERGVGLGFALRLVRGLARVAGGNLAIDDRRITLILPAIDC